MKPPPLETDLTEPWGPVEPPTYEPAGSASPPHLWRSIAAHVGLIVVLGAAVLAMVPSLSRLRALDSAYYLIVLFAIGTCAVVTLVLAQTLRLTPTATLAMLTSDLVLKALLLTAVGRLPDLYALATIAVAFPTTPVLLSLLFRHRRVVEEPAGDFTTGRLLRNKQARERRDPIAARAASGKRSMPR